MHGNVHRARHSEISRGNNSNAVRITVVHSHGPLQFVHARSISERDEPPPPRSSVNEEEKTVLVVSRTICERLVRKRRRVEHTDGDYAVVVRSKTKTVAA